MSQQNNEPHTIIIPVPSPRSLSGQDIEFPPCSGFGQALLCHDQKGAALDSLEALGPLPSWLPRIRGHWLNKDHQLSPDSVQTQLETPVPWDLEAHTGPFILELKDIPSPTISWMRPGSLRPPPTCPPGCLGEQVTESPASQPSRGFIQTQLLSKTPMSVPLSLPRAPYDLTCDLTYPPVVWVQFSWLTHTDTGGCAQRTMEPGCRWAFQLSIKGLHWGCNTWEQILLFSLFAWTLYINQVLEHRQFSMSASIQWKLWTESLELTMTTCCLLLSLAATKVARSFQKIRMGEPPIYPTTKIQITALLHV